MCCLLKLYLVIRTEDGSKRSTHTLLNNKAWLAQWGE